MNEIYNPNPTILKTTGKRSVRASSNLWDLGDEQTGGFSLSDDSPASESIDQNEIFGWHPSIPITVSQLRPPFVSDLVRFITDPEHKHMTLEELMVVSAPQCSVSNDTNRVLIEFTPTVPHCGMSTVIGALSPIKNIPD
jgi:hypothetical protein